ncbi:MAG: fibronectin type III domain-containing protein [Candidatus Thermoplasmatota archaeon]|nr:fibronectin type III domain-containing protein [Candidatus Thermoplasmatota archaeon]
MGVLQTEFSIGRKRGHNSSLLSMLIVMMLLIVVIPLMGDTDAKETLTVLNPNGGESWTAGSTQKIRWSVSNTGGHIGISLSLDGGRTWEAIKTMANSPFHGVGSYDWIIPANINSTKCRISVKWVDSLMPPYNLIAEDESDSDFTIKLDVYLEFTENPDTVAYGKYYLTKWDLYDPEGKIAGLKFSIRTNDGSGWGGWASINSFYDWYDPTKGWIWWTPPYFESGKCQIRVEARTAGNTSTLYTATTPEFDIISPGVTLLTPDGGVTLVAETTYTITWRTSADPEQVLIGVHIRYSTNSGTDWTSMGYHDNDFSYDWKVPNIPTTHLRIQVSTLYGEWYYYDSDSSSADNTIISSSSTPSITLIDPNPPVEGGVVIGSGETYNIRWSMTGILSILSIKMEYSTDNGASYTTINTLYPGPGLPNSYGWVAPAVDTYTARVKLTITISGQLPKSVVSNNPFYIFDTISFNRPPVAIAGPDQTSVEGTRIYLDGRSSYDPDGDPLIYVWTQVMPAPITVTLQDASTARPYFSVELTNYAVNLVFQLEVRDGIDHGSVLLYNIDRTSVHITPLPPQITDISPNVGWSGTTFTITGTQMMGADILFGTTVIGSVPTMPLEGNPDPDNQYTFVLPATVSLGIHDVILRTLYGEDTSSEQIEIFLEPLWQYEHGIGFDNGATHTLSYPWNPWGTGRYRDAFDLQVYLNLWICIGLPYWTPWTGWGCLGYEIEEPFAPCPLAAILYGAVFHYMARGGECFGMSTTALQYYHGDVTTSQFGQSVPDWNDLERTGQFLNYIQWRQGAQLSAEILNKYLYTLINSLVPSSDVTGIGVWISAMKLLIDSGKLGIATMICDEGAHAVVPYAYEDTGDRVRFYVYDSNRPEFSDPETAVQVAQSSDDWNSHPPYIEIERSGVYWDWEFEWPDGTLWTSNVGLAMVDYDTINGKRTLPLSVEGIINLLAGSASVRIEDEGGNEVGVSDNGSIIWGMPEAYPLPMFGGAGAKPSSYLLPDGNYTTHITGTEDGHYNWSEIKDNSSAFYIEDAEVGPGSNDKVSVVYPDGNPYQGEMNYGSDDESKEYNASIVHDYGEGFRTFKVIGAELNSDEEHGDGQHSLKVTEGYDGIVFTNLGGGPTTFDVEFTSNVLCHLVWNSSYAPEAPYLPTATRSGITVGPGETVIIRPLDWMNLSGTVVVLDGETVPGIPRNLNASVEGAQISLSWDPPSDDGGWPVMGFEVLRGISEDELEVIASVDGTSFVDDGVDRGATYYYSVRAMNVMGLSELAPVVSASIPELTAPSSPRSLSAVLGADGVLLTWDPPADDGGSPVTGYVVYRAVNTSDMVRFMEVSGPLELLDTEVENGTTYRYAVLAVNSIGDGPLSQEISISVPERPEPDPDPEPPDGEKDPFPWWIIILLLIVLMVAILLIAVALIVIGTRSRSDEE